MKTINPIIYNTTKNSIYANINRKERNDFSQRTQ